jgi:hypothetical protein
MISRDLLNVLFGSKNIDAWADLNNNKDEQEMEARIAYAIAWAPAYIRTLVLARATLDETNLAVQDIIIRQAGIWLYESRGISGDDATKSPIAHHRMFVDTWLKNYCAGSSNVTLPTGPCNING